MYTFRCEMDFKVIKSDKMSRNVFTFIIFIAAIISIHFFFSFDTFISAKWNMAQYICLHIRVRPHHIKAILFYTTQNTFKKAHLSEKFLQIFLLDRWNYMKDTNDMTPIIWIIFNEYILVFVNHQSDNFNRIWRRNRYPLLPLRFHESKTSKSSNGQKF